LERKAIISFSALKPIDMKDAEPWTEWQISAMRSILLNWGSLSRGDIAIVTECIRNPAAMALTVRGSPHAGLWHELTKIGWAEQLYSPIDPYEHDPEPLSFRLTSGGERPLSHFLVYYDLLNMGACTPTADAQALKMGYLDASKTQKAQTPPSVIRQALTLTNARFAMWLWGLLALFMVGVAIGKATS